MSISFSITRFQVEVFFIVDKRGYPFAQGKAGSAGVAKRFFE